VIDLSDPPAQADHAASAPPKLIRAAGTIVTRKGTRGDEVLIIHRARYDDWTLPKGKLKSDETFEEAALRETREETGYTVRLAEFVGALGYEVKSVPKVVLFWRGAITEHRSFEPSEEVAEIRWLPIVDAVEHLSHSAERDLVIRALAIRSQPYQSPGELPLKSVGWRWSWPDGARAYSRLERELETCRIEVAFLAQRNVTAADTWVPATRDLLTSTAHKLSRGDIEAGWHCLHKAQRLAVHGLTRSEIRNRARMLLQEADKLSSWRRRAVKELLDTGKDNLTAARVVDSMALRDEYAENQYHKIRLMGDQLRLLLVFTSALPLVVFTCLVMFGRTLRDVPAWDANVVLAVQLFGILGAGFSATQSIINNPGVGSKIPERVANYWVTLIRALSGASAGLAGYAFVQSGVLNVNIGDGKVGTVLATAFVFGYTGERLVAKLADTIAGKDRTQQNES